METPALMEEADKILAPVRELNKLALENLEKLVELQLASVKTYSDLTLAQLKAVAEAKDVEDVRELVSRQYEVAQTVGQRLSDDMRNIMDLGNVYVSKVEKVAKESVKQVSEKVA